MEQVKEYVRKSLEGFDNNPPDTDFQRGYQAALKVIWHEALHMTNWDRPPFKS